MAYGNNALTVKSSGDNDCRNNAVVAKPGLGSLKLDLAPEGNRRRQTSALETGATALNGNHGR